MDARYEREPLGATAGVCDRPDQSGTPPQEPIVLRKKKSRSLRGFLLQAVFVMQAPEHGRLVDAMTGWQLVPMVADRNPVLGGFRQART